MDPENAQPHFAPAPIEEVVKTIMAEKPAVVFAPHVETSTGIILPDDYIKQVAARCTRTGVCLFWIASRVVTCGLT